MAKISSDKKWELFNRDLEILMKGNDFGGLGVLYYEMAEFLRKEGKDDSKLRELGYKMKSIIVDENLKYYKKNFDVVTGVEIIADKNSCPLCKKLNGKIFSLAEVFSLNPLPVKDCSYLYGCRCTYGPKVD